MVKRRDAYRVGDSTITIAAAANFIADNVSSNKSRKAAYENAYGIIVYAREAGHLPPEAAMDASAFFSWAVERKDWAALKGIPGLSFSARVLVEGLGATTKVGFATSIVFPAGKGLSDEIENLKRLSGIQALQIDTLKRDLSEAEAK